MVFYSSYYKILNVHDNSSIDEIKTAFRKLSKVHHPDKNNNSPESNTAFMLILNAYNILADPIKRNEYDAYLRSSSALSNFKKTYPNTKIALPLKPGGIYRSNEALLNHFNFILWDIEDLIRDKNESNWNRIYNNLTLRQYILIILTFIDKWVLDPAGYHDHFMEARKMERLDPRDYVNIIGISQGKLGHSPYAGITDYFYNVRKRIDRFLENITTKDLIEKIPDNEVRLIDCIIEAQNLTVHYLSYLLKSESGRFTEIPPFKYSHSCFIN